MAAWENAPLINAPRNVLPDAESVPTARSAWESAPLINQPAAGQSATPNQPADGGVFSDSKDNVGAGTATIRSIGDMLTYGHQDEILAGLDAAVQPVIPIPENGSSADTWRQRYNENVANQREQLKTGQEQHPIASAVGGVVGAIIPAVATLGASLPESAALAVGKSTLGRATIKSAGIGAAQGAAYGFGSAEGDVVDRLPGAGVGALIGGTVGAAAPAVISGVGAVARKVIPQRFLPGQSAGASVAQGAEGDAQAASQAGTPTPGVDAQPSGPIGGALDSSKSANQHVYDTVNAPAKKQDLAIADLADYIAPQKNVVDAMARLGIHNPTPGEITGNPEVRGLQGAFAAQSSNPLTARLTENRNKLASAADDLISEYGGSTDKAAFSMDFKDKSLDTINGLRKEASDLYDHVGTALPESTPAPAEGALAHIQANLDNVGGDVSLLPDYQQKAYRVLTADPDVGKPLQSVAGLNLPDRHVATAKALSAAADDLVTANGGSLDKARFSDDFKQQGVDTRDALETQSNSLYQQLNTAIPKTTFAPAKSTVGYLAGKLVELGGRDELLSPAERLTLNALSPKLVGGSAVEPTYSALDTVRRQVAAGYKGRGPFADSDSHDLDRLYATLSQDQQRAVEAAGPEYGEMFSQAKGLVAQRKQLEDSLKATLGKDLSGSVGNVVSGAVKKLATGDFQSFDRTLSNIPDSLKSQSVLTGIGDAFSGGKGKGLNIPAMTDWYRSLQSNPAALARLESHLTPEAAQQLRDLNTGAANLRGLADGSVKDSSVRVPTFKTVDNLRRAIESKAHNGHFADAEDNELQKFHGALLGDQQKVADAHGVGVPFASARYLEHKGKNAQDNLTDLLGRNLESSIAAKMGPAIEQLRTGNTEKFETMMRKVPKEQQQSVVMTALSSGFTKGSRTSQDITPKGLTDWYDGLLKNKAGLDLLYKYMPEGAQKRLEDVVTSSRAMAAADAKVIGTGISKDPFKDQDAAGQKTVIRRVLGLVKPIALGEAAGHLTGITGLGSAAALYSVLRTPKTPTLEAAMQLFAGRQLGDAVRAITNSDGALRPIVLAQQKRLVRTMAYRKWERSLNDSARARIATVGPLVYLTEPSQ
ncbi:MULTISPECIES: hypothetical protein [unclassified Pseudomonas]|uniref:hypothetical protein n=1 Tax=unclassified Pseudomonas TaxID=196821 RepID=UPI002B232F70|nr:MULTISPECIES: hypothetical protein [unclassified Pseudomonas]MEA9979448.1 hypothetical protein [Pseudomonas sp. RTS4]MEB0197913.1 hypothetical protein [Pseudomonas sp. 5S4]MEB0246401.1 hypothetical protein [Pseudomonas sp. 10S5]